MPGNGGRAVFVDVPGKIPGTVLGQGKLDLSKVIWKFPVKGINKDMVNTTAATATGIQIIHRRHVIEVERRTICALIEDAAKGEHRIVTAGVTGLELQAWPEGGVGLVQPGLRGHDTLLSQARLGVGQQRLREGAVKAPRLGAERRQGPPKHQRGYGQRLRHLPQKEPPDFSDSTQLPPTPTCLRMISSGQKLLNKDWSRLKPTKAVNQNQ